MIMIIWKKVCQPLFWLRLDRQVHPSFTNDSDMPSSYGFPCGAPLKSFEMVIDIKILAVRDRRRPAAFHQKGEAEVARKLPHTSHSFGGSALAPWLPSGLSDLSSCFLALSNSPHLSPTGQPTQHYGTYQQPPGGFTCIRHRQDS